MAQEQQKHKDDKKRQEKDEFEANQLKQMSQQLAKCIQVATGIRPDPKAHARISLVIMGELHSLAFNAELNIMDALSIYKPIVRLRNIYQCQNVLKASYYWVEVT